LLTLHLIYHVATFLATHKIPDYHLALGLDRMARDIDDKQESLAFIDYKSLGVRNALRTYFRVPYAKIDSVGEWSKEPTPQSGRYEVGQAYLPSATERGAPRS